MFNKLFVNMKLKKKMMLMIGMTIFLTFCITIGWITVKTQQAIQAKSNLLAEETALKYADEVKVNIEDSLNATRTIAASFTGMKMENLLNRTNANAILKSNIDKNPNFLAVWTAWEPNALDGSDSQYVNSPGHDQTGRFIPYWTSSSDGLKLDPLTDYTVSGAGDYYLLARDSGKETILNPYLYKVNGKDMLITSVVTPIILNGKVLGVVGIDVSLDYLQQMVAKIKPFETGSAALIANDGIYVASDNPANINKPIENLAANIKAISAGEIIRSTTYSNTLQTEIYQVMVPIQVGSTTTPWSFQINAPINQIMKAANDIRNTSIIIAILSILILLLLLNFIINSITNPVKQTLEIIQEMSLGHLGHRVKITGHDEIGQMAFAMNGFADYMQNIVVGTMKLIARGDVSTNVVPKDDQDEIGPALKIMTESIRELVTDANMLVAAAVAGNLDNRADAAKHQGDFRKIVEGVNDTLDAVIGPLNMAAECVERISKGDIPDKITDNYNGDFNAIKNNLNLCFEAVSSLVEDANQLSTAAIAGTLSARADEAKHGGDFRKIVVGFNHTLDAVIGPLHMAAEYVDQISKGEIPAKITDSYNGDFNEIKNNLNKCIDGLGGLVEANTVLQAMAVNDHTQKVTGQYAGVFAEVGKAVNEICGTLQQITGIVNNIARGDISDLDQLKQMGEGRGRLSEKDQLAPSFIQMIESVKAIIDDTDRLSKAAIEGNLDARADESKHDGGFRQIVIGFNQTLDALIGPLHMAAEYVDQISKGEIPAKITASYNGDFNEIKNNLNKCIDGLGGLVEANTVLQAMAVNDHTQKVAGQYAGVFAEVGKAVNEICGTLQQITGIVNNIARGDISDLGQLKQMGEGRGRLSEKDQLAPAFIQMIESVKAIIDDTDRLSKAAIEGNLDARADESKHDGGFRQIVIGFNQTLNALIGPLHMAAEYVDQISKGEIPAKITASYNGDFNEIKNNLNKCIDGLGGLVEANTVLQAMAVNDHTQKVTGQYAGVFAEVGKAVNEICATLLQITGVVNNIARGDISDLDQLKQMGEGRGRLSEKDQLAPAFIQMIESVKAIIDDTDRLSKAAIEGNLDARADESKHGGGFRQIVVGFNQTLNALIGPLHMAAEYVDQISKGEIPAKITASYNGDFNEIKNNLNKCIDGLGGLVEANTVLQAMAVNDHTQKVTGQYAGVFAEVGKAVNEICATLLQITGVVNNIARGDISDLGQLKQMGEGRGRLSEKDQLAPAFIQMIESVKAIIDDTDRLSRAAIEGKLDARADESKHGGGFQQIVAGFNQTLDAVIEPINEAAAVLKEMASGNLQHSMVGDYKGEFAQFKEALNLIISTFNQILSDFKNTADQVDTGSQQVSDGSQALSQGATEQASAIEQLTSSIHEIATQTKQNASNANEANVLAGTAQTNAVQGNGQMKEMLHAMEEINKSSLDISKIIKVIDEIAFQTNILALNAAVEAARAGQHGKGFAVVAEEVRNLAARSANAAKETTGLIEGSITKVTAGTKIANDTAGALDRIVNDVAKAAVLVESIAVASNEQATGIAQINQGVSQVAKVVQTNSATAEESAAASEELSSQAALLTEMINGFKLSDEAGGQERKISGSALKMLNAGSINKRKTTQRIALGGLEFGKY